MLWIVLAGWRGRNALYPGDSVMHPGVSVMHRRDDVMHPGVSVMHRRDSFMHPGDSAMANVNWICGGCDHWNENLQHLSTNGSYGTRQCDIAFGGIDQNSEFLGEGLM